VCSFNDKYIFVFGGKQLHDPHTLSSLTSQQSFSFVSNVEVYEIEKNQWKVINYISESSRLRLLNPGCYQVTGKKILIFGGVKPPAEEEVGAGGHSATEGGRKVNLSGETCYFNVTNGEIVSGPEMSRPSYFVSGSFIFPQQGKIHAFGFTNTKDTIPGLIGLSAAATEPTQQSLELNHANNKRTLHFYKVAEEEWHNVPESVFTGQRKMSMDTLDETF
jgi:hypothetical protein